ncbi:MAG: type 2 isopentenyl-diphosphate Delta-isomerase [Lentisphaerae bacterium]|nr:type 2 isopentenyl-diphosphate Delta-isomerase [Lentisphaerota bacterium]
MKPINQRKTDHVKIAFSDQGIDRRKSYFDRIHLTHRALPELDLVSVDPSITLLGKRLSFPLLISSMTGGADEELIKMNRNLAVAAEAEGVALAVGSQRVLFLEPAAQESFALRCWAPSTVLLGNLGAIQLSNGMNVQDCEAALNVLDADGLFLHLNPLQEVIQPEGDTNFSQLHKRISEVVRQLSKPLIVKEVGAGISAADVELLCAAGVRYIDVAGSGGTSWSMVESRRSAEPELGELFADWGLPTPLALRKLKPFRPELTLLASGGIRNGIDMVKSMVLGATVCGMARPFLRPARESSDAVRVVIQRLRREFVTAMFLLGVGLTKDLLGNEELILDEHWN